MKARHFVIAVLAMSFAAGCGRDPPQNLTVEQIDQLIATQKTLADEQAALGRGRDALEEDRRRWAARERREPIIAESIQAAAILLSCSLPMVIVAYLLLGPIRSSSNELPVETFDLGRMIENHPELLCNRSHLMKRVPPQSKPA